MWWVDRPRHGLAVLSVLAVAALSAGCIRPLYGPENASVTGGSVRATLASIDVPMIPNRLGHTLRNELVFLLEGRDNPDAVRRYRLQIAVTESVSATIVNSTLQRADAATVSAIASYSLVLVESGAPVTAGSVSAQASYERSTQRFASLRAARDAQQRVARLLAEQIHYQLAGKLSQNR
jgi:LPS-assembly lipoprotein